MHRLERPLGDNIQVMVKGNLQVNLRERFILAEVRCSNFNNSN